MQENKIKIPRQAKRFQRKTARWVKRAKRLRNILHWHEQYTGEVFCPFCGVSSGKVKTNGNGFYRCKGICKNRFFLLKCTEELW